MDEGEGRETQGDQKQAHGDQFGFAHFFDEASDGAALHRGANDTGPGEEQINRPFVSDQVEAEVSADQQVEGGFKAGETESRQKKDRDDQRDFGLAERMRPLLEAGTLSSVF